MLYRIKDGTVSLGGETVLSHIDFEVKGSEKIAVVGKNGAGKTTLLRLIAGELALDRDDRRMGPGIFLARDTAIGILHQHAFLDESRTVEEEILSVCPSVDIYSKERFDFEQEYDRVFTAFGFEKKDKGRALHTFSGGEQTKIALIRLLLEKPDILLLDEPTNHLDMGSLQWLEEYLASYPKAAVMVSHDRFFLDQTARIVYELSDKKLTRYAGNYTEYREQKEAERRRQEKKYQAQQLEIARLNAVIERFKHKPKKAAMARSKRKALERMERVERPGGEHFHRFTEPIIPSEPGSKRVLETNKLKIGYEVPLKEITLGIRRGQKLGIIGENGMGKTTFLKTITGQIPPLSGSFQMGLGIHAGYFDQMSGRISSGKRVWEHFHDQYPGLTAGEVKKRLGQYLFRGEDTAKKLSDLSGGEKNRLAMAELLESRPNFLILDEPTSHMDIPAKETLESALKAYTGTILFISHDRYFIREIADSLLIFEEGRAAYYPFGYEHYLEHLQKNKKRAAQGPSAMEAENTLLVEALHRVPGRERAQSPHFSEEQAYADWQLDLAIRQMEEKKKCLEEHISGRDEEAYWCDKRYALCWEETCRGLMDCYDTACRDWYEKWADWQNAFAHYQE